MKEGGCVLSEPIFSPTVGSESVRGSNNLCPLVARLSAEVSPSKLHECFGRFLPRNVVMSTGMFCSLTLCVCVCVGSGVYIISPIISS